MHARRMGSLALSFLLGVLGSPARGGTRVVGINDHLSWRGTNDQNAAFAWYDQSGTRFVRTNYDWNSFEGAGKGVFNPTRVANAHAFFRGCAARGVRVLVSLAYAPAWANADNSTESGWAPRPENAVDYADFCEWFLRQYATYTDASGRRTLEAIELWNEPDLGDLFYKPYRTRYSAEGAIHYANLVVTAGTRLKTVRQQIGADDVLILAPAISDTHNVSWAPWLDAFYGVPGVTQAYDVFSWHSYWFNACRTWPPSYLPACFDSADINRGVLSKFIGEIRPKLQASGDDRKPNWCTELGAASRGSTADYPGRLLTLTEQSQHLADAIAVLRDGRIANLERIYWYEIFDEPHAHGSEQVYGIVALTPGMPVEYPSNIPLASAVITPKPAYAVYRDDPKSVASPDDDPGGGDMSDVSFYDNFDDGEADGWQPLAGNWNVAGDEYRSAHAGCTSLTVVTSAEWVDATVSVKMRFTDPWKCAGVVARLDGALGYYLRVDVNGSRQSRVLSLYVGNSLVQSIPVDGIHDFSVLRDVKLSVCDEANGVRLRGSIDNVAYVDYLDTATRYRRGRTGLRSEPWSGTVGFDNVWVTPAGASALADNFDDGDAEGWAVASGTWSVAEGQYRSAHVGSTSVTSAGSPQWADTLASVRLKFSDPWKGAGVVARFDGISGYYLRVDVNGERKSRLLTLYIGETPVQAVSINNVHDFATLRDVSLAALDETGGVRLLGSIDHVPYLDYVDAARSHPCGKVALRTERWSGLVSFDNVSVAAFDGVAMAQGTAVYLR